MKPTKLEVAAVAGIELLFLFLGLYVWTNACFDPAFKHFFPLVWLAGMVVFAPWFVFCMRMSK